MKKKVGIIKRLTCLSLIFLLSINSFAAIVSDNDGSAFITKAEFDALKASFQSQISDYNKSIDSKIDGAIASYLSGIKLSKTEERKILLSGVASYVGYFDDSAYTTYVGMPTLNYSGASSTISASSGEYTASGYEAQTMSYIMNFSSNGLNNKKWLVTVTPHTTVTSTYTWGSLQFDKIKMNGYYKTCTDILDTSGNSINMPAPSYWPWLSSAWFAANWNQNSYIRKDGSYCYSSTDYLRSYAYTYSSYGSGYSDYRYDPLYVSYVQWTRSDKDPEDIYWIAYKGNTKKTICSDDNTPFFYMGYNNHGQTNYSYINFYNQRSVKNTKWTGIWGRLPGGSYASKFHLINTSFSMTYTSSYNCGGYSPLIGGIGNYGGHDINQQQEKFQSTNTKIINVVDNVTLDYGLPLLYESNDTVITYPIKFKDKTKNYRVWLAYEPFTANQYDSYYGVPHNGIDYVDIQGAATGQPYIDIANGEGDITWTMGKDSFIYMKWQLLNGTTQYTQGLVDIANAGIYSATFAD